MATAQRPILCQRMIEMLQGNRFSIGDRIPGERRLAEMFVTSRNTIREVLCNLETMGYVEIREKSGCYLKSKEGRISWEQLRNRKSQQAIRQLLQTLSLLVPALVREQSGTLSPEAVAGLEKATARLGEAVFNFEVRSFNREYISFFLLLAGSTQNDYLILLFNELLAAADNLEFTGIGLAEVQTDSLFAYHVELFNALRSGKSEEAFKAAGECIRLYSKLILPEDVL